jgi:predicted nucleic acid-binding protein
MTFTLGQRAIVIDASAAIAFLTGEEGWADRWESWNAGDAMLLAPAHFAVEVANVLLRGVHLTAIDAALRLERLFATGIETADRGVPGTLAALELADRHGLTVYDAAYLQLAKDVDGELASLDRDLVTAATREGVAVSP